METVSCCHLPPVAYISPSFHSSRIVKSVKLNGCKYCGGLLNRNVGRRHRLRSRHLAIRAKGRVKGDFDEETRECSRYAVEFNKNEIIMYDSKEKLSELPLVCASPISSIEPLVESNYFVEGSKTLSKNDGSVETEPSEPSSTLIGIPGLPDGNRGSPISSYSWEWKHKWIVHYKKAGSQNVNAPPVLFLPGFGVGAFHYENQLRDLGQDFRVWASDFLGQGRSLPSDDPAPLVKEGNSEETVRYWGFGPQVEPWAQELVYSVDLWRDQIRNFVEEVIGEPIYVVGNSLGGYVGLYFAACYPQLVRGIILLNATPFWAFIPNPSKSPIGAKLFPWAGSFPVPPTARKIIEFVWSKISEPESIKTVLKQVYADRSAVTDELLLCILEAAEHPAAAASFASIIFSPQGELSFKESLSRCRKMNIPMCLIYGKEDPWVKPVWGQMVKMQVPDAVYYEISPAGHCPHSEVPEVVNFLLRGWINNVESKGSMALPLHDDPYFLQSDLWRELEFEKMGARKSVQARVITSKSSLWQKLLSVLQSLIRKLKFDN